jgi:bacillithiol system protein YtxJ
MQWNQITTASQLDKIDEISKTAACLIFKNSTRCHVSAAMLARLEKKWEPGDIQPFYLDLLAYPSISNTIATRYMVPHESPQVLLIKDGRCIMSQSHMHIRFDEIQQQISS